MARKDGGRGSKPRGKSDEVVQDPRFARLHADPRFQRMPKKEAKVPIDARFQHIFKDKDFADPHALDKRGRKTEKKDRHSLRRYYRVADEEKEAAEENEVSDAEEEEEEEEEAEASPSESSSSSSDEESELEEEDPAEEEEKVPTTDEETKRLAMVNMDWQHIKAVDLLVLMRSFLPKSGDIISVKIYPSEFGLEQMKQEEVQGPTDVFDEDEEDEDPDKNMEKLRQYEKAKLRYYYAVVECDSSATANSLYKACDGMEFERTSNTLDLRFIPDEMEFKHPPRDVATEVPAEYKAPEFETRALQHSTVKLTWDDDEPVRMKALRRNFNADQLNEMDFAEYLASETDEEGDEEVDVEAGATDTSPSGPEAGIASNKKEKLKEKYRSLLLGDPRGEDQENEQEEMEVTFHTGLDELSQRLQQKKEEKKRGEETVWEGYLRKKREKKKARGKKRNGTTDSDVEDSDEDKGESRRGGNDPFFDQGDDPFNDPFFTSADGQPSEDTIQHAPRKKSQSSVKQSEKEEERAKRKKEKAIAKEEEERSKAELELLLMDDHGVQNGVKGFNLKKQKGKRNKKAQQKEETAQDEEQTTLAADLEDPRFAPLFDNHNFAIEPTDPQFRRSSGQMGILAEKQRRKAVVAGTTETVNDPSVKVAEPSRKKKAEITSMVQSLKRKLGKIGHQRR